jgi:sulfite exporter TauE/SafE
MPSEITLISAFLVGVLGSTHCVGMCGGILGALTIATGPRAPRSVLPYVILYTLGRIASYAVAGAIVGFMSERLFGATSDALRLAAIFSAGITIFLGFYLSGWWMGLNALERLGAKLWKHIEPIGRRVLPVNHPAKAVLLGLVWGWLPCGLVYTALAWSLSSGSALRGAALLTAFGAGTLPMLLLTGIAAPSVIHATRQPWLRRTVAVILISFGVYLSLMALGNHGVDHGHAHMAAV